VEDAQARGETRENLDLDHLAELILRLTFSIISGPSPVSRGRAETKRFLTDVIGPVVSGGSGRPRAAAVAPKPPVPPPAVRKPPAPENRGTADRLLETAAGLFREKGYAQSSTRELAELLGIRKASLYHHIRTKEDLLEGLCLESLRRLTDEVESTVWTSESPVRTLVEVHLAAASRDRDMHLAMLLEHGALSPERRANVVAQRDAYARLVRSVIVAEQQAGRIRTDIDAKYLSLALLNIVNWTIFWFDPEGERPAPAIAAMLADVFLDGAATAVLSTPGKSRI
jgi:AcrR family transcriptional regulator